MNTLIMGMRGSGKSEIARALKEYWEKDKIICEVYELEDYSFSHRVKWEKWEAMIDRINKTKSLSSIHTIIITQHRNFLGKIANIDLDKYFDYQITTQPIRRGR
jgi:hypothetical protein